MSDPRRSSIRHDHFSVFTRSGERLPWWTSRQESDFGEVIPGIGERHQDVLPKEWGRLGEEDPNLR